MNPTPTETKWEIEFEEMNKNCDGAYGCGQFPPEVKKFIRTLLSHQRTTVLREVREMMLEEPVILVDIRMDSSKPHKYQHAILYKRVKTILDSLDTVKPKENL